MSSWLREPKVPASILDDKVLEGPSRMTKLMDTSLSLFTSLDETDQVTNLVLVSRTEWQSTKSIEDCEGAAT
jgi:hypothetical protein